MIYVCIATHNDAQTVGVLLWKIRKVFAEFPREYHILVADDGSTDGTGETLDTYQQALPMTLTRWPTPRGRAASLEALFRDALERSDRPRRDGIATLPADFSFSPEVVLDLIKRFESGADVVIGESDLAGVSLGMRLVHRWAPQLLRPGIELPGLRDPLSGVTLIRLVTLKNVLADRQRGLFETDGPPARAELVARAATRARQIAAVPVERHVNGLRTQVADAPLSTALALLRAGRRLRIPAPSVPIQRSGTP